MRTVITISLNGNAYQLEAAGYDSLRAYLQVAEQRLVGNPDQMEILADLEQAVADKCSRYLGPHKNVVSAEEIAVVLQEMGPVDGGAGEASAQVSATGQGVNGAYASAGTGSTGGDNEAGASSGGAFGAAGYGGATGGPGATGTGTADAYSAAGSGPATGQAGPTSGPGAASSGTGGASGAGAYASAAGSGGSAGSGYAGTAGGENTSSEPHRRLYQIRDGAMISGVCKGVAAYLNIDVSIVRILFILVAIMTGGVWILVYIVMMFVIPYAETSEQHAAAHGWPFNAEELVARAKEHYAQFRDSEKSRRQQWREQRRMWKFQRKQWKEQRRDWERWGSAHGTSPPTPPWNGQQPGNTSYASQVLNGVLGPIAELLGAVLFITFLILLFSLIFRHRVFGWWWPHDIPWWLGIVILVMLYRVIAAPLRQARYAAYYGAPFSHGWVVLWGALVWLALLGFLSWLTWQHWDEVQEFFQQQILEGWRWLIDQGPAQTAHPQHVAIYLLSWVPSCSLYGCARRRELQSHRQVDSADVFGEPADRDVIHTGLGDVARGVERNAAGSFDFYRPRTLPIQGDRSAHIPPGEFIEHDDIRLRGNCFLEFSERFNFNLDRHLWRNAARLCDSPRERARSDNVVFLDEHPVIEPHPMILSASAAHGVLLRGT